MIDKEMMRGDIRCWFHPDGGDRISAVIVISELAIDARGLSRWSHHCDESYSANQCQCDD